MTASAPGGVSAPGPSGMLPARRGGAKALLLTVLGEFVAPTNDDVWTSTLVAAAHSLGIGEKNARQAIARMGEQGLIEASRHGRTVRWGLTARGRTLLESGARRIYSFGTGSVGWDGEWLVAHCAVAESQRGVRSDLRKRLGFLGFGELSPTLLISPHGERESELRVVLAELGLMADSVVLRSRTGGPTEDIDLANRAWNLSDLGASYAEFSSGMSAVIPTSPSDHFRALVELVHDWRRFPFVDPELPTQLLPTDWAGHEAAQVFHRQRSAWSAPAQAWFAGL